MEIGPSSSVYSAYSSVRSIPRTSPSALTISVTTRPQPPCRFTRRQNAVSVIPAIGAMAKGDGRLTEPIFIDVLPGRPKNAEKFIFSAISACSAVPVSICLHVRRVDLDADRLANEVHRQHEACFRRVLANQPTDDTAQRTVNDLDHHPFMDQRTRVVLQLAS